MLMFACFAVHSPVAHGGQELFRVLLGPGQMAHNHGMTPSATRLPHGEGVVFYRETRIRTDVMTY
jgi:hypothetical protein